LNDTELNQFIGTRIKHYRMLNDLTQGHLAKAVGVGKQQIGKFEHGKCNIKAVQLIRICAACNISTDTLLDRKHIEKDREKNDLVALLAREISPDPQGHLDIIHAVLRAAHTMVKNGKKHD